MPLSRLDLPRIAEAIRELHRTIATPPAEGWKAPAWLVEQYKQTTLGEDGVPTDPTHAGLIDSAATEVLNRLMPPWHHSKDDCPEITESLLDPKDKVTLLELRDSLSGFAFGTQLASNRAKALRFLLYLETVLGELTGAAGPPTCKEPGVISLNVLANQLTMLHFPDWRRRLESWPEVSAVRLACARLFPGHPFTQDTIELLIAWFQERGLPADQARYLPLAVAVQRLRDVRGDGNGETGGREQVARKDGKSDRARKRGRKPDTDAKKDRRIAEAWRTKRHRTYQDLANELRISKREVKAAIDRERHRRPKRRGAPE